MSSVPSTFTFPNGFRVIYERPHNQLGISALRVFVDFGSAHEPETLRGSAHFIEHMCFKGKDLFVQQHRLGNMFNAETDLRFTAYTCKVIDDDLEKALDVLATMTLESAFLSKDFVSEERVVVEECLRSDDDGEHRVQEDSLAHLYAGSSFAFPIDATAYHKSRGGYNAKKIKELYHNIYVPQNMILSIVTDIPLKHVLAMLQRTTFSRRRCLVVDLRQPLTTAAAASSLSKPQFHFRDKPGSETAHIQISFRTCPRDHPDRFILDLLQHIIGGTLGSKLFILLREKHGLTYVSRCETHYHDFSGYLSLYAQVDKDKVLHNGSSRGAERFLHNGSSRGSTERFLHNGSSSRGSTEPGLVPLLQGFIQDLVHHGITADELRVGKRNKRAQLRLAMEHLDAQAEYNGKECLLSSCTPPLVPMHEYYDAHFKGITRTQILRVCRTYFRQDNMVACFVGPKWSPDLKQQIIHHLLI
jgi:predicted Zn-dependent peptidase